MIGVTVGEAGGLDSWGFDPDKFASVVGPEAELSVGWGLSTAVSDTGVPLVSVGVKVVSEIVDSAVGSVVF